LEHSRVAHERSLEAQRTESDPPSEASKA
jgi:hypothetical protein